MSPKQTAAGGVSRPCRVYSGSIFGCNTAHRHDRSSARKTLTRVANQGSLSCCLEEPRATASARRPRGASALRRCARRGGPSRPARPCPREAANPHKSGSPGTGTGRRRRSRAGPGPGRAGGPSSGSGDLGLERETPGHRRRRARSEAAGGLGRGRSGRPFLEQLQGRAQGPAGRWG